MTVNELYRSFLSELTPRHSRHEADNITSMIFEHIAGIDRQALIKEPGKILKPGIISLINGSLIELKNDKPVQYITGEAWFYKMRLKVSAAVLIPRPETEELVEAAIHSLKDKPGAKLIDIGTGSGCIAVAIKKNVPGVSVTAIDISADALNIAKENAAIQQTDIQFVQTDFLKTQTWEQLERYDLIISNPPYIPEAEEESMDKNVTAYEPHIALFVDSNRPLAFYEHIAEFGKGHLNKNGMIFLETHEGLAEQVAALFNNNDLYKAVIKKDLFEKQRMVIVTRSQ